MSHPDWQRLWRIFHDAVERSPGERESFLDSACADDAAMRDELNSLLRAHEDDSAFLEPVVEALRGDEALVGQRIDAFQIESLIGHGGMGSVFLAHDLSALQRPVALKLIKRGMDSDRIVARFEYERQTLALMQHPNIASVFAAGCSADGRPYFVMELVRGLAIDRYADANQLDTRSRLLLFAQLCSAVAHAHQRGVIHRDLKPSNVLVADVDGKPLLKVIDFGIAKAIAPRPEHDAPATEAGLLVGTPEYMSPEQAAGGRLPIDTRSDVYSLGIMLYQLLVGALPFDTASLRGDAFEIHRVIRDSDPPMPSQRARQISLGGVNVGAGRRAAATWREIRGGLDWIILKAIAKEPEQRYASVAALQDDVDRQLSHRPLQAAPPSRMYRLNRFIRRHRIGSAVTVALIVSASAFSIGLWRQMQATEAALNRAQHERARAQRVTAFLVDVFEVSDPSRTLGQDITAREVLDRGAKRLRDSLDDDPETRATLMDTVAEVYQRLGLFDESLALQEEALQLRQKTGPAQSTSIAAALSRSSVLHRELGHLERAESLQREALSMRVALHGPHHIEVTRSRTSLALILRARGERDAAQDELMQALATQAKLGDSFDPAAHAATLNALAGIDQDRGDHAAAEDRYRKVLALRKQYAASDPLLLANARNNLGSVLIRKGDYAAAEIEFRATAEVYQMVLGDQHPDTATALNNLAVSVSQQGRADEALPYLRMALAIRSASLGADHPEVAVARYNIGRALMTLGRATDALVEYRQVREVFAIAHGETHPRMAILLNAMAHAEIAQGNYAAAEDAANQAQVIGAEQWPDGHEILADSMGLQAEVALNAQRREDASSLAESALNMLLARLEDQDWRVGAARLVLGEVRVGQGRVDEARALLESAYRSLVDQFGPDDPRARRAAELIDSISAR